MRVASALRATARKHKAPTAAELKAVHDLALIRPFLGRQAEDQHGRVGWQPPAASSTRGTQSAHVLTDLDNVSVAVGQLELLLDLRLHQQQPTSAGAP